MQFKYKAWDSHTSITCDMPHKVDLIKFHKYVRHYEHINILPWPLVFCFTLDDKYICAKSSTMQFSSEYFMFNALTKLTGGDSLLFCSSIVVKLTLKALIKSDQSCSHIVQGIVFTSQCLHHTCLFLCFHYVILQDDVMDREMSLQANFTIPAD